jgi:hypothetical protein
MSTRLKGGFTIFGGDTTYEDKRDRTRRMILDSGYSDKPLGKRHGEVWTFSRAFFHIFGENL